jgi:glutamate synthase (NADPH/NADH) small chain
LRGYTHELHHARVVGVRLIERATPAAFVRDGGALKSIRLADSREFPCELAILAIGQGSMASLASSFAGVKVDAKGRVQAEEGSGRTANPKLWVGGDATGGELVVTAVQDGKRAARSIGKALGIAERGDAPMKAGAV